MQTSTTKIVEGLVRGTGGSHLLGDVYLGNSVLSWLSAAVLFVVALGVLAVFKRIILVRLQAMSKRTKNSIDDVLMDYICSINRWFYVAIALYIATGHLALTNLLAILVRGFVLVVLVSQAIRLAQMLLESSIAEKISGSAKPPAAFVLIIRVVLWTVGLLLVLSNLGVNVTSLLASLGIGGLAVSLALQPIFTDIFSSFSIALDKPFEVGDYIQCGSDEGTVMKIGLKTTRIETLRGEELVIANTELTNARVLNYKKMSRRRIEFTIGVTYDTPRSTVKKIPGIIKKIITDLKLSEFERSNFFEFGDSNLNIVTVYYVTTRKKSDYMKVQEQINLAIMQAFEKEGIEMAFPTRTVHLVNN